MILSIGEILTDFIGEDETKFRMCCGGAPFNVAVNAKRAGAKVGFIGRVGKDPVGNYLKKYASEENLDLWLKIKNEYYGAAEPLVAQRAPE